MKNKMLIFLLIIPLIVLGLYNILNYNIVIKIWQYLILYLGIISLIYGCNLIHKKIKIKKVDKKDIIPFILVIIFIVMAFISTLNSSDILLSLYGTGYRRDGFYSYLSYIGIGLISMFVIKDKDKNNIYKLFVAVGFILTIFTRFQFDSFLYPEQYLYNGIFFQFNHISYFLILCLVCNTCLYITAKEKKETIAYVLTYLFMLELLIKNNTFGGYIAILFTTIIIIVYYLFVKKIIFKSIILLILFITLSLTVSDKNGVIVLQNFSSNINQIAEIDYDDSKMVEEIKKIGTNRMGLWMESIKLIKEKPILGYGIENIGKQFEKAQLDNDKPHNLVLGLMVFIGIPGALALLSCFSIVIIKNIKNIKNMSNDNFIALMGTVCYLVSSMFGNSMFYTQPYFSIFFGFLLSEIVKKYIENKT